MSRCRNSVHSLTDGPAHSQGVVPLGDEKNPFGGIGMAELPDRFWEKVEKTETCWLWTASRDTCGYGHFRLHGKLRSSHRLSFEALVGPIPGGLNLDHLCRVRHCVNPQHLELVTHRENCRRGDIGVHNRNKTHCPQGHEYSYENTYFYRGWRACKTCNRQRIYDTRAGKGAE